MQPDELQPASSRTDTRNARCKKHQGAHLFHSGCGWVCRRDSYPGPGCWRTAVTQLRVCLEGKQEQNDLFYPLAVRSSLAAVIARCSSAQVEKRFTGSRTHPSRRRKRSLEAAGDDAAAAAAFVPSRRGMREVVGVGAADDPRRNRRKYTHRTRNRRLTSKRWLMNHYAH